MMQSLHIFRKDARHLWPDLSLYAALLIAFCMVVPYTWDGELPTSVLVESFSAILKVVLPLTMLVIIARLVHDECLVGDEQFWTTRPYEWTSLLGAKLLFIVLFVVVPFVAMQWMLLLRAGLRPLTAIPGLLLSLAFFALIVWLPFTVVAAVTASFSRTLLSLVGVVLAWLGILTTLDSVAGPRMTPPFAFEMFAVLSGGLLAGILLYQYAVRNTVRSRIALVATAVLLIGWFGCFLEMYVSGPMNSLIRHHYAMSSDPSLRLVFDPSMAGYDRGAVRAPSGGLIAVRLPVHVEGLDASARLHDPNVAFTIDAPGVHYVSPWRPINIGEHSLAVVVPREVFDRVRTSDVRMHLTFVAQRLLAGTPRVVTVADDFSVPDNGRCLLIGGQPGVGLVCRYAFQGPPPTRVSGEVATEPCGNPGPTQPGSAVIRTQPAGTRPDPVIEERLQLGGAVCPGTQLTFVAYHPVGDFRMELDMPAVALGHYAVP